MKNFVFGFLLFIVVFECNATGTYKTHKQCMQGLWMRETNDEMDFKVIKGNTSLDSYFSFNMLDDGPFYSYSIIGFVDSSKVDTSTYSATISSKEFLETEDGYRFEIFSKVRQEEFFKTQKECHYQKDEWDYSYCDDDVFVFTKKDDNYYLRVDSFPSYYMNFLCVHHEDDLKYFFNLSRKDFRLGIVHTDTDSAIVYDEKKRATAERIDEGCIVNVLGVSKGFVKFKYEPLGGDCIVGYLKKENLDLDWDKRYDSK